MAFVYSDATKTARMNAIVAAAGANARLEIGTANMAAVLATFTFGSVIGTVSGDTLTFSGLPLSDSSADATGIAAAARIRTAGGVDVITGFTVSETPGAGDFLIDNASIKVGQLVQITTGTIKHG